MAAAAPPPSAPNPPERLKVEVVSVRPHDPEAFTQGLLLHGGSLYESAGNYGKSSLREVDPKTGAVKRKVAVPPEYFAEGLALVDDRLIQITWKEEKALVYDRADFKPVGEFRYDGEGWGLCWDGARIVMSDGSDRLTFRDPKTFATLSTLNVTRDGKPGPGAQRARVRRRPGLRQRLADRRHPAHRSQGRPGDGGDRRLRPADARGAAEDGRAERHRLGPRAPRPS